MSSSCSLDAINYAKIVDMECYKFLNNHIHTDKEVEDLYKLVINILNDDISTNFNGSTKSSMLHLAYREIECSSGKLNNIKTFGLSLTSEAKNNKYSSILNFFSNELKNLKTESGKPLFNIEFFIGDNVMMHHMLGKKLSFSHRSKDSCRSCTLDGNQWKEHIKAFSTRKFIRNSVENNFSENNFLVHDTFHDLHGNFFLFLTVIFLEGVVSYMLFLSINLFMHRFKKNSSYVKKEIMIQACKLKLHSQLASVLKDEFFTKKQGKKGDFNTKDLGWFILGIIAPIVWKQLLKNERGRKIHQFLLKLRGSAAATITVNDPVLCNTAYIPMHDNE
uniref:DC_STAMP domain-containing protein n=1 Tax=Strongyloides papillosus TaxID=174720 RepID=A0A0N5C210_STREA